MKSVTHDAFHLPHGAYGHNRDISDTVFPYQLRATLLVNSASGELKFH